MGNKIGGRRKQVVEEKYTRPQGLYQIKDVDFKKLRKLILDSKLAPCYPGADDSNPSLLEECPICFLFYPTLNRSRCCMKSICTECFLQMKNPNSTRPTQCPFCKTSNYAVEYRGGKSKEERGMEQIEEQKVIEAKIRMRQQEMQEEEERQHRKDETNSANTDLRTENIICSTSEAVDSEETSPSQDTGGTQMLRQVQYNSRHGRDDEFDLDLEDIMVMEAIWLSIQENGRAGSSLSDNAMPETYAVGDRYMSPVAAPMAVGSSSSPSGGLACAIAALAERQQLTGESSSNYNGLVSPLDMLPSSSRSSKRVKKTQRRPTDSSSAKEASSLRTTEGCEVGPSSELIEVGTSYVNSYSDDEADILPPPLPPPLPPLMYHRWNPKRAKNRQKRCPFVRDSSKNLNDYNMIAGEWEFNHGSEEALSTTFVEAGTTFASSDESDDEFHQGPVLPPPPPPLLSSYDGNNTSNICSEGNEDHGEYILPPPPPPPPQTYVTDGGFQSSVPGALVPESFEEQMMLAMAVSLAEARVRTTAQGVAWH